jgi:hypothetical protein
MADAKKPKGPKTPVWGAAMLWALGQWAVCWFVTETALWDTVSATCGAFASGWVTAGLAGRLAKWGLPAAAMAVAGLVLGLLVFSGAVAGLTAALTWSKTKDLGVDWTKLQEFLLSPGAIPPAALGLVTGLYVKAKVGGKK